MLLSHNQLVSKVVNSGVLEGDIDMDNVNGSSIDITLGDHILVEEYPDLHCPHCGHIHKLNTPIDPSDRDAITESITCAHCLRSGQAYKWFTPVDFGKKEPLNMRKVCIDDGFTLWPGDVCLASSVEVFNLPSNLTAEYRLKSSQGRVFLEHLHAGWCDPGWHGSVLTLEFKNESKYHPLVLRSGMKCGQVMFYTHDPVPEDRSYAKRGQYNNDKVATASKGIK